MSYESPARSRERHHSANGPEGGDGQSTSLQRPAAFLKNWSWQSVALLNERLCQRGRAEPGKNPRAYGACEKEWTTRSRQARNLMATLEWLRWFHRKAPFRFFNGNTFAEIGRTLTDAFYGEFPPDCRRAAASLAAHYVAGVLHGKTMARGLAELAANSGSPNRNSVAASPSTKTARTLPTGGTGHRRRK